MDDTEDLVMARGAATPVYVLIEQHLRGLIGKARPGDALPSDSELCELFGVSRMTARQAVQRLADEGLLYRVSGSGTFVAQERVHRRMNRLLSFSEEMRRRGLEPSSRVLDSLIRPGSDDEVLALRLPPGSKVVLIRRLRLADGVPMAVERVVLPTTCAVVRGEDLAAGSLHEALRSIGRVPTRASGALTAMRAGREDVRVLELPQGSAVLVERRTVFDQTDAPVEYTETRYAGERYVFDVELTQDSQGSPMDRSPSSVPARPRAGRSRKAGH